MGKPLNFLYVTGVPIKRKLALSDYPLFLGIGQISRRFISERLGSRARPYIRPRTASY